MKQVLDNIKRLLTVESIRKSIENYFVNMGIELDYGVYPPLLRGLNEQVPCISNKIEIQPHIEHIDPTTNYVRVGWNLFVNGTHRKPLGFSTHASIANMDAQVNDEMVEDESHTYQTPKDIINFIIDVLCRTKDIAPGGPMLYKKPPVYTSKIPGSGGSGTYYQKNKLTSSTL